jgi:hypothetical protein
MPVSTARVRRTAKPRLVVHLGNMQSSDKRRSHASKTLKYARRFQGIQFVGIDLESMADKRVPWRGYPRNFKQIEGDFETGLRQLANNSVDVISSEMALGHYTRNGINAYGWTRSEEAEEHTRAAVKLAFKKLKKGGKMTVYTDDAVLEDLEPAMREAFGDANVKIEEAGKPGFRRKSYTYWTKNYGRGKFIIAVKK